MFITRKKPISKWESTLGDPNLKVRSIIKNYKIKCSLIDCEIVASWEIGKDNDFYIYICAHCYGTKNKWRKFF